MAPAGRRVARRGAALAAAVACAVIAVQGQAPDDIRSRIERRLSLFRGTMGVSAVNLATGERIDVNAALRFPTASLIKVAVLVEVAHQIADGRLARDTPVTLQASDKVGDEPVVLNQLHDGLVLTVGDLMALMIAFSDNTATNMLIARAGTANVNARMDGYGLKELRLFRPTFRDGRADVLPDLEREFGLGMTTPRDIAALFVALADGKVVSRAVSDDLLAIMERTQDRAMIPRHLPYDRERLRVANKTGWDEEKQAGRFGHKGHVRTDAAYVRGEKARYVIAICARDVYDRDWGVDNDALRVGAAIARDVHEHFSR
ncbi:MAG: serine hydrolase [Acidobacteria bacterium]|jgi:beta-lactamase class A|nr:serine hydrolase [Acidobacteriota bacterium]